MSKVRFMNGKLVNWMVNHGWVEIVSQSSVTEHAHSPEVEVISMSDTGALELAESVGIVIYLYVIGCRGACACMDCMV